MFETVWKEHVEPLRAFLRSRVNEHAHVDDLLQEVALKAYVAFKSGRVVHHKRAYLYRIAKHVLIDDAKKRNQHASVHLFETEESVLPNNQPEHSAMHCLRSMLACLKPDERDALMMQSIEGFSEREVAARFGLSLEGARSRVKRAKKRLRQAYEQCCEIERNHNNEVIDLLPKSHNGALKTCALCG